MGAAQLIVGSLLCAALANVALSTVQRGPVQYQKQTEYGTYKFGYDTGDQFRQEHRGFDGVVHGRYGYKDANGKLRYVEYSAGPFGYRVKGDTGADDVPQGQPLGQSKTYKAPSDQELSDLQAGLAEIKRQQLFGVPVQPYVKGYHQDAPPPQRVKEVIIAPPQPPPPPPPPKIEQQVFVAPHPPHIEQVVLSPPPAKIEQVVIPPPKRVIITPQVIVEPVKTHYVKGYQPPIVTPPKSEIRVIVPPKQQQQIFQHPVEEHYTKGYQPPIVTPPKSEIRVIVPPKQQHQIFQRPVEDHYTKGYVVATPAPKTIVVHQPPKQIIVQQPVVVQKPVVIVHHPIKSVKNTPPPQVVKVIKHPQIFQRPVEDHYTKGYVAPTQAPIVKVVPPSRPTYTKGYVANPTPPRVVVVSRPKEIVYSKGQVKSTPQRVVVVKQPQRTKTYVPPPRQQVVIVTNRPRIFEQPVQPYVKGYVQPQTKNSLRRVQPCEKCRGQSSRGTFPQSVAREYVFSRPVQPYVKGYVGTPRPSTKTNYRQPSTKGEYFRRVQQSGSRGDEGVVWIPAPSNRYRDNSEYYEPPHPAYAYAPY